MCPSSVQFLTPVRGAKWLLQVPLLLYNLKQHVILGKFISRFAVVFGKPQVCLAMPFLCLVIKIAVKRSSLQHPLSSEISVISQIVIILHALQLTNIIF